MRRALILPILFAAASCGRDAPAAPPPDGTPEYQAWKGTQISIPAAGFATTESGSIEVIPAEGRVTDPDAFCEFYVNGSPAQKFRVAQLPDGTWPTLVLEPVRFRTGTNWIDMWDSTTNHNYRQVVDTRQGTAFVFTPTDDGYELKQSAYRQ